MKNGTNSMALSKYLSVSLAFVFLCIIVFYIKTHLEEFLSISFVSPGLLILLCGLFIVHIGVTGLFNSAVLKSFNIDCARREEFGLVVLGRLGNYLTPMKGGLVARALYLKKKHDLNYLDFVSTQSASYVIILLIIGVIGLVCTALIFLHNGIFSSVLCAIFLAVFIFQAFLILFSPQFSDTSSPYVNKLIHAINGWHKFRQDRKLVATTLLLVSSQFLLAGAILYFQFQVFGIEVSFEKAMLLTAIGGIGILISITPSGFGIEEAILVFSAQALGIPPVQSLAAALLGRGFTFALLLILAPFFYYQLYQDMDPTD